MARIDHLIKIASSKTSSGLALGSERISRDLCSLA
jgi:hypothetical protein